MKRVLRIVFIVSFLLAWGVDAGELGEVRTWTSASGKTLEAQFAGLRDGSVILKTAAGKQMRVARSKLSAADQEYLDTDAPLSSEDRLVGNVKTGRILFLGNSITQHKPKPGIGWTNNCGMAASSIEKDYVHVLARSISEITGTSPVIMIKNIYHFEKGHRTYDLAQLKEQMEFKADTVILAIGENVPGVRSEDAQAQFKASVLRLLTALKDASNPTIIVRSSFWADKNKDKVLKDACAEAGGIFVDNSALRNDKSNYGRSERSYKNGMVGAHPGDKGMQAIADSLLTAMKATKVSKK
jgi:hypothetical protein